MVDGLASLPDDIEKGGKFYHGTVCPGSSDPPEKIFYYICIRKLGLHRSITLTIVKVEYYRAKYF